MAADTKVWDELVKKIEGIGDVALKVGIVGQDAQTPREEDGLSNVEIGLVHEFGSEEAGIPERSFIRQTFKLKADELAQLQVRLAKLLLQDKIDVNRALGLLGTWAVGAIKATITIDGKFVPLKPATIAAKKSSKPLIDSSQLIGSITWVVVE